MAKKEIQIIYINPMGQANIHKRVIVEEKEFEPINHMWEEWKTLVSSGDPENRPLLEVSSVLDNETDNC